MSSFSDILSKPLPSQQGFYHESDEDDDFLSNFFESEDDDTGADDVAEDGEDDDFSTDEDGGYGEEDEDSDYDDEDECGDDGGYGDFDEDGGYDDEDECGSCDEDGEDDFDDLDDLDDDDIANSIEDIDDDLDLGIDDDDDLDDEEDEDDDETPKALDPEEDKKADDLMAIAATPMLIRDELTAEEAADFYESADMDIAINEGMMLESDAEDLFEEGVFASPNKPFKMTKRARFRQLYEMSVLIEGRAHNDPKYIKLQKAYKIERTLKKDLRKKYHSQALRRAKIYLKRLMSSKSGVLNKIGKKMGLKK